MADDPHVQYRFESDALAGTSLIVHAARVAESLNEPYVAEVGLTVAAKDADVTELLGRDAVLTMERAGAERRVCGIVYEVVEGVSLPNQHPRARLVVVPALRMLGLRRNTRMFQGKTVPEILEAVLAEALGPYGRSALLELDGKYDPREYCLQYQETDLDFIHRLMEEEGIAYTFDHGGGVEELVLTDANAAFVHVPTVAGDGTVSFAPHNLATTDVDPVHTLDLSVRDRTTSIAIADYDWTQSPIPVREAADGADAQGRVRESYEHGLGAQLQIGSYDEGIKRYQKNDAAHQATLRQEAAVFDAVVGDGVGRVISFVPGGRFQISGHPSSGADGEYLLVRVEHVSAPPPGLSTAGGDPERYHNRFVCIPFATPYRPRRKSVKPRIDGVQSAVVTGPSGEEVHVDPHGRIKVRFHWDRENPADETSSCWVRVKQEWAGPSWGFWWVPRIGMEVLVHFIDGDPDRPLCTGSVYDAANPTPYPLPDEKTKSTIKSNSSIGGGGFNEFRFEDKAGSEEIYTHAQKDYNEVVENDHTTSVGHDQKNTVDNDQTQKINANQTERVDANQTMTVGGDRTVHVKGDFEETVDGTETRHTKGDVTEAFDANETRAISGNVTETISGNETRSLGADQSEDIAGSHTETISGDSTLTVSAALTQTVTGGITTTTPAAFTATATAGWTVTANAGILMLAPGGATLNIPGGVTRADSFWEVLAGEHAEKGTIQVGMFVAKVEAGGLASSLQGLKLDFCFSARETDGLQMHQDAVDARIQAALDDEGGGADVNMAATNPRP